MTITAQVEMFGSAESYYVLRTLEPLGNSEISSNWSTDVDFVYKVSLLFKTQVSMMLFGVFLTQDCDLKNH